MSPLPSHSLWLLVREKVLYEEVIPMFRYYVDRILKVRGSGLKTTAWTREVHANRYDGYLHCIQNFKEKHVIHYSYPLYIV